MFVFSLLESLVHVSLDFLSKSIHLVLLFLDQLGFSCYDFLVSLLEVLLSLIFLHLLGLDLHLMGISVLLLSG